MAVQPEAPELLTANGIAKSYGGHLVLKYVDFAARPGEVVAVIGENGAGKSTFAKIVAGAVQPESGELALNGQRVSFQSPRDALKAGVAYIPQELAYLPNLSVADNIMVGRWPHSGGVTGDRGVRAAAAEQMRRFGIEIDVRRPMSSLTLAERQLVEIVKALSRSSSVLILDEPTASLTSSESKNLFRILRQLTKTGLGVIFISHRMDEIFAVSDRVVVLRNGEVVADVATPEITRAELIQHMLGAAAQELAERREASASVEPVLELAGWSWSGEPTIHDFNLTVHKGEVVCLFGLRGAGGEVIAEALAGRNARFTGEVLISGRRHGVFSKPAAAGRAGIGYVPAERKREGLVMPLSVQTNLTLLVLKSVSTLGWISARKEHRLADELRQRVQVRARSLSQVVANLSGGNQQKVLLASRLAAKPRVLVLQEPTRGVDVGARFEIHRYLRDIAARGTGVLWVTTDVEEAVLVADRLIVMREGSIVGELTGSEKTQGRALELATKDAA